MTSKCPRRRLFLLLIAGLIFPAADWSAAQDPPVITIRKGETVNVALRGIGGDEGGAVTPVLQNDLTIIGSINLVPPDRASFIVSGTASGGRLQARIEDRRGDAVLSKTYSGSARSLAHQFADDIVETLTGQPGIATTIIAFVSTRGGNKEIYTADYDGANVRQLTRDGVISVAPALSWDGRRLAYTGYQSGYADIYTIDLASGNRRRIVNFPGTNSGADFSPDGNRIACTISKDGNPELYVVGANGSGARRLTRTRGVESSPTWSPDGREIIYTSDDRGSPQLYRIGATGGTGRLLPTGHSWNTEPNWSPDGTKVAFVTRGGGGFSIAVKDLASGSTNIVAQGVDPVWGGNSRHLLYATRNGSSLVLLDTVSGRSFPIITGLGQVSEPTWSRR